MRNVFFCIMASTVIFQSACTNSPGNSTTTPIDSAHTTQQQYVESTISRLSQIGVGQLGVWKDNGMGGYMSITPYYQLGDETGEGMSNNIALYLESEKADTIQKFTLVLNLNRPSEKKQAWSKMQEITPKLFAGIGIPMPDGLKDALRSTKTFLGVSNGYKVDLKLEKTKIDTWLVIIEHNN